VLLWDAAKPPVELGRGDREVGAVAAEFFEPSRQTVVGLGPKI